MGQRNYDIPENWSEIEPYVLTKTNDMIREILCASKCFFYDTCAFRNHMRVASPEKIFDYIKLQKGLVILTRTVIMELCSNNHKLWEEHIAYIKNMKKNGITVLAIAEEDIFSVLNVCYSGITFLNKIFSNAVKYTKSKTGAVEAILQSDIDLRKAVLSESVSKDGMLAKRFFEVMRKNKRPGDNLGEELIAICIHLLANIPETNSYKYIVLTDDYAAITLLGKVIGNVEKYIGVKCISAVTTSKLCWLMKNAGLVLNKESILEIIKGGRGDANLRIYSSEKYELKPSEKNVTAEEFAEKLINDNYIKIYL